MSSDACRHVFFLHEVKKSQPQFKPLSAALKNLASFSTSRIQAARTFFHFESWSILNSRDLHVILQQLDVICSLFLKLGHSDADQLVTFLCMLIFCSSYHQFYVVYAASRYYMPCDCTETVTFSSLTSEQIEPMTSPDEQAYLVETMIRKENCGREMRCLMKWHGYPDAINVNVILVMLQKHLCIIKETYLLYRVID